MNLNTASASELEELPGVGPELAGRIIEYREKKGQFSSVEELDAVDGIGPGKLENLIELVTI
jgi:competence protein ComEA